MQPLLLVTIFFAHSTNLLISAGFDQIREDLVSYLNYSLPLQRRRFTDQIIQVLGLDHMKEGYGCWCYFDPESITGKAPKGVAVNTVDEYCRSLQHGYQCAEIDGVESGFEADVCEPHSVFYYPFQHPKHPFRKRGPPRILHHAKLERLRPASVHRGRPICPEHR